MRWIIQSLSPPDPSARRPIGNSPYRPLTRSPWNVTSTLSSLHLWVSYVPRSQMLIVPAPYSPAGISPWNSRYWSG